MNEKLSVYDYLAFLLPGGIMLAAFRIGVVEGDIPSLSGTELILWSAAAFVVGHIVASIGSFAQPWFLGQRTAEGISQWGLFGDGGIYSAAEKEHVYAEFEARFGDSVPFSKLYDLGYTRLQQLDEDGHLQMLNTQIAFYRNMAVSLLSAAAVVLASATFFDDVAARLLAGAVLAGVGAIYIWRLRKFWRRFGYAVCRGVMALPLDMFPEARTDRSVQPPALEDPQSR